MVIMDFSKATSNRKEEGMMTSRQVVVGTPSSFCSHWRPSVGEKRALPHDGLLEVTDKPPCPPPPQSPRVKVASQKAAAPTAGTAQRSMGRHPD